MYIPEYQIARYIIIYPRMPRHKVIKEKPREQINEKVFYYLTD